MPSVAIHVLSLALCLSSGFQQGYIASVLNQPYKEIEIYMNVSWENTHNGKPMSDATINLLLSFLNVTFPIATIFGQFAAAFLVARLGRRWTAIISCVLYIPGTMLSAAAKWIPNAWWLLYVGRIIWAFGNGIASVTATVWIVECAPPAIRGRMAAMQEMFMSIGSLVTQALGVPFSSATLWEFMFIPNALISFINIVLFFFVKESPQFLIERKQDYKGARSSLAAYHGVSEDDLSLDEELKICEAAVQKKLEAMKLKDEENQNSTEPSAMAVMFMPWKAKDPQSIIIRQNAWVGLMVKVAYVFTGARCLRAYSSFVLYELAGWTLKQANLGSLIIGILRVPITLIPILFVDKLGRRPLLLVSTLLSVISLVLMEIAIDIGSSWKIATMIGLSILLLVNAAGLGAISRFYCAELVPRNVLLQSVSILTALEAVSKIGVEFAWYPIANIIKGQAMLLFSVPTLIFLIVMWFHCPETSQKGVNQVLNETAKKRGVDVTF